MYLIVNPLLCGTLHCIINFCTAKPALRNDYCVSIYCYVTVITDLSITFADKYSLSVSCPNMSSS